jgi:hypothetical protein
MGIVNLIKTSANDESSVRCEYCKKSIAKFSDDIMTPSHEECYKSGNVPVPNFGWFCSQSCGLKFEEKYGVRFGRTKDGIIDYYFVEI